MGGRVCLWRTHHLGRRLVLLLNTYRIELFEPESDAKRFDVDALKPGIAIRRVLDTVNESDIVAVNCRLIGICVPLNMDKPMVREVAS